MDIELTVALVAAVAALVVALVTAWWNSRTARHVASLQSETQAGMARLQSELGRQSDDRARALEAREVLDRYRKPLMAAAEDLRGRVANIRMKGFWVYFPDEGHRGHIARVGTLYRLAAFLGWVEVLHRELTYLAFETQAETKEVAKALERVSRTLATDRYDRVEGDPLLMLWREEQRAIGGLMLLREGRLGVIGFEVFAAEFEARHAPWFESFMADLHNPAARSTRRLELLQLHLENLVTLLDTEGLYAASSGPVAIAAEDAPTEVRPIR